MSHSASRSSSALTSSSPLVRGSLLWSRSTSLNLDWNSRTAVIFSSGLRKNSAKVFFASTKCANESERSSRMDAKHWCIPSR